MYLYTQRKTIHIEVHIIKQAKIGKFAWLTAIPKYSFPLNRRSSVHKQCIFTGQPSISGYSSFTPHIYFHNEVKWDWSSAMCSHFPFYKKSNLRSATSKRYQYFSFRSTIGVLVQVHITVPLPKAIITSTGK